MWDSLTGYWQYITWAIAIVDLVIVLPVIAWILSLKKESTSAIAWCLLVILVPLFGALLFVLFGYQNVNRPLKRKRQHRIRYRAKSGTVLAEDATGHQVPVLGYEGLGKLATRLGATLPVDGNRVELFTEGRTAFASMFEAIEGARHHIHLQFYIFRFDRIGRKMLDLLIAKAKAGVEVRLLVDGVGARNVESSQSRDLLDAGGKVATFLPVSIWRRRFQVNLRNHRKTVVTDGRIGFTGGLNVGDEYLGESAQFGPWRDTFMRVEGPAVDGLQSLFIEDWNFAHGESLQGAEYFPPFESASDVNVQVISSGPDMEMRPIREIIFAAMLKARKRLWVTSPYYVPDQGIRDALCLAAMSGVDVRLLLPKTPDHWMPHFAGRYYTPELLACGVKVYRYTRGFLHGKVVTVDGEWASVGTANLDNRSLLLNFEVSCLLHTPKIVAELESQFLIDLDDSVRVDAKAFAKRRWPGKMAENVCRLFAPVL